ncbi:natural cytotoxicity triggering receptor 3 ligand 1-like isoform X2 [Ranitomeya imitator]|uniref:natural cytotoxicity triggering receptor 3 ligand 1-like isoform X2 n=1 Tax=Ranitomeya imitator TaxID=111125 RepID=UPI0037E96095
MQLEVLELKNKYKHPGGRDPELFRICRYCHEISSAEWFGGPRVEMDLIKKCVVFVLLLHTAGAELERYPPITYLATLGSDSVIPCEYIIEKPPVDPRFFSAFWFYRGNKIASFENEVRTTDSRYSLDTEKALYGRVELSISNISVSDAGVYTCSVRYNPEWKMRDVTVDVQAPPQVAITNRTVNEKSVLLCSVTGFYPAHIAIKWFRGSERLSDVTEDRLLRNLDGTYSVNSTLTITPTEKDREQNVSCRVQHESLKQPLQEDFQLEYTDNSATSGNRNLMIIIPVVLGLLLIIIVIVLIIYFKRKKQSTSMREFHSESNKDFVPVQACTQGLLLQTEIDHKPNTENTEGTRDISSDSNGGAELKEISTEWRPENSEEGSPGDGDNKETSLLNNS